ncbi:MAG: quinone-dependent dihydroorotate dehydrogenase [Candidatus Hydrogenedens sp.]|nr:quinone-dependent dihydroorotate dehydrogenase [Candidatus Hydrogenedens sp.]
MHRLLYPLLKPALFQLEPEQAHAAASAALRAAALAPFGPAILRSEFCLADPRLAVDCLGLQFPNPVGLAAGYDKNATLVRAWPLLGFGHAELGAVTPRPQPGNPKPRVYRHPAQETLQNAMGFNNDGLDAVRARLQRTYPAGIPIGINLGKNKDTPEADAVSDYTKLIQGLDGLCDYFVINISSPNTPGLRGLLNEAFIAEVFGACLPLTQAPVLLKVSPDAEPDTIVGLCRAAVDAGAAGIIATNTTVDYALCPGAKDFGGLSGRVLTERSFAVFQAIAAELYGKTTLISVGGIDSADEAWRRIVHGASLVQVYTGMIYKGPGLVRDINAGLLERLEAEGIATIQEATGAAL